MRPNGGRGGAWHLTFTLSPADGTIAPPQESSEFFINHKKIFKLKILKTMKKIKLFALAIMAMLSTNAFATDGTGGIFKITYADLNSGIITGLTTDLSDAAVKDIVIPATVTDAANGNAIVKIKTVGQAGGKVFEAYKTKIQSISFAAESNCEEIVANAFEGLSALTTVNFTNATNLTTIGAAAFKGTAITALDLTKTKVAAVTSDGKYHLSGVKKV